MSLLKRASNVIECGADIKDDSLKSWLIIIIWKALNDEHAKIYYY